MTKEQGFLRITHNILYINNLHKDIQIDCKTIIRKSLFQHATKPILQCKTGFTTVPNTVFCHAISTISHAA